MNLTISTRCETNLWSVGLHPVTLHEEGYVEQQGSHWGRLGCNEVEKKETQCQNQIHFKNSHTRKVKCYSKSPILSNTHVLTSFSTDELQRLTQPEEQRQSINKSSPANIMSLFHHLDIPIWTLKPQSIISFSTKTAAPPLGLLLSWGMRME